MYVQIKDGKSILTIPYAVIAATAQHKCPLARVRGEDITKARLQAGVKLQVELARECRWPQQHQSKFEKPGLNKIPLFHVLTMIRVLSPGKTIGEQIRRN